MYRCGHCNAGEPSLYRDDDRLNGHRFVACRICGNRYPGGKEPVKAAECGKESKKEVVEMTEKKPGTKGVGACPECNREGLILYACHGRDICGTCKNRFYKTRNPTPKPAPKEVSVPVGEPTIRKPAQDDNGKDGQRGTGMRWIDGETRSHKVSRLSRWHEWFAWYPVRVGWTGSGHWIKVWLATVLRRGDYKSLRFEHRWAWEYREIKNE